jgi:hypothetical protein
MPIYDYALLALLASGAAAGDVSLTLGPEVIGQPNGGVVQLAASHHSTQSSSQTPIKTYSGTVTPKSGATSSKTKLKFNGVDGESKDKDHKSW